MRLFASICIAFSAITFTTVSSSSEQSPYIYYHSEALNAIIIERADGRDSHIIARNLMPTDHEAVSGPGWSPSGKWLAWTSARRGEYGAGPARIWVMSADGKQRLSFLDSLNNVYRAIWSPTGDYLLIIERSQNDVSSVQLVDVDKQFIVTTLNESGAEFGTTESFWSEDGKSVQLGYPNVRILHVDGRVENNVPAERREPLVPAPEPGNYLDNPISPNKEYEIVSDGDFAYIHDLKTDQTITLRPFSGFTGCTCGFDWYPDSGWLLINFNRTAAGGGCSDGGKHYQCGWGNSTGIRAM